MGTFYGNILSFKIVLPCESWSYMLVRRKANFPLC